MAYTNEECERLLASAISYLLDGQEFYEASILLLCDLYISEGGSSYSGNDVITDVTLELRGSRAIYEIIQDTEHQATTAIIRAFKSVLPSEYYLDCLTSRVAFADFDSDWREKFL